MSFSLSFKKLKSGWNASPGPRTKRQYLTLYIKALAMGIADVIPGVSGGTIAFITGIYEDLLNAIASLRKESLTELFKGNIDRALAILHLRFLFTLIFGVLTSILIFSRLMHFLITEYAIYTWSFFFGLILASIPMLSKKTSNYLESKNIGSFLIGTVFAFFVVGMIPVETPQGLWFIFICGFIGITAMILPGISGSFLLLILGKYEFITAAVKNPLAEGSFVIIAAFALGALTSLLSISKGLAYLYRKYTDVTISFLSGVLLGSLRKIWPWKETLETKLIGGKLRVIKEINIFPQVDSVFLTAFIAACFGVFIIFLLNKQDSSKNKRAQI